VEGFAILTIFIRREHEGLLGEFRQAVERLVGEEVRVEAVDGLEDLKHRLREVGGDSFLFFFVGPNVLSELKKVGGHVGSLDELVMHVAGTYTNERIVLLTTSRDDEDVLVEFKAVYEVTPRQLDVLRAERGSVESLVGELKRLLVLGYNKALLCSPDLALSSKDVEDLFLEVVGVKKGFSFINALEVLRDVVGVRGKSSRPSSFEVKRILPCIADSTKIRVIAEVDAPLERALPYLYLHFKNSKYLEPLGVLTFTTTRDEMVSAYSSGKVCVVKVESEGRAKEILGELLKLISKAHDLASKRGPPSEEELEARRRLNVMSVYRLLPKTNCGACGEQNCMAFAAKLLAGEARLSMCRPLIEQPRFKELHEKLKAMLSSPLE